jgi:hypothetical protein
MDAARRAEKELGAEIVVIRKTSKEYGSEKDPPPCPTVLVNGRTIARKKDVTFEALKAAILNEGEL